jgi:hypothetical protein
MLTFTSQVIEALKLTERTAGGGAAQPVLFFHTQERLSILATGAK